MSKKKVGVSCLFKVNFRGSSFQQSCRLDKVFLTKYKVESGREAYNSEFHICPHPDTSLCPVSARQPKEAGFFATVVSAPREHVSKRQDRLEITLAEMTAESNTSVMSCSTALSWLLFTAKFNGWREMHAGTSEVNYRTQIYKGQQGGWEDKTRTVS